MQSRILAASVGSVIVLAAASAASAAVVNATTLNANWSSTDALNGRVPVVTTGGGAPAMLGGSPGTGDFSFTDATGPNTPDGNVFITGGPNTLRTTWDVQLGAAVPLGPGQFRRLDQIDIWIPRGDTARRNARTNVEIGRGDGAGFVSLATFDHIDSGAALSDGDRTRIRYVFDDGEADNVISLRITYQPLLSDGTVPSGSGNTPRINEVDVFMRAIPEPATAGLLGLAGLTLLRRRRRD